jgi:hypothetical protein
MVIKGRPCKVRVCAPPERDGGSAPAARRGWLRVRAAARRLGSGGAAPTDMPGPAVQVVEVSTSKTGKHGHAKCHFVALDIFTNRKMEELVPSSHNLEVRGLPADAGRAAAGGSAALARPPRSRQLPRGCSAGRTAAGSRRRLTVLGPSHTAVCVSAGAARVPPGLQPARHFRRRLCECPEAGGAACRTSVLTCTVQVSLMDDAGNCKDDLKLPADDEIANGVRGCVRRVCWAMQSETHAPARSASCSSDV